MSEKKDPPFFSDDNLESNHYRLAFCETMDLLIETLTGTCFRLRVSPFETVVSVKAKIQRLEGIPVSQQHLIWNSLELDNECCLHDYSIEEGCTLKLVLAMRGGPINTRRVTVKDSVKDTCDCSDLRPDEEWEKSSSNKQVTLLVYREGNQLNFFRVVDRSDGTHTPVSKSQSGSGHGVNAEEEEEGVGIYSGPLSLENSITMSKMRLLKAKMENMNLHKKPKKIAKLKVRPPVGPRPGSGSLGSARHHRMLRILPQIGDSTATHLPPTGDQQPSVKFPSSTFASTLSPISSTAIPSLAASGLYMFQEDEQWNNHSPRSIRLPPRVDVVGATVSRDCLPCLEFPDQIGQAMLGAQSQSDIVKIQKDSVVMDPPKPIPFNSLLQEPLSLDVSSQQEANMESLETVAEPIPAGPLLSQAVGSDSIGMWSIGTKTLQSGPDLHTPPNVPRPITEFTGRTSHHFLDSNEVSSLLPCSPSSTPPLHDLRVDSCNKRPELISRNEVQGVTMLTDKPSTELTSSVSNAHILASLAGSGGQERLAGPCGRFPSATNDYPQTNAHLLPEELLRRIGPLGRATLYSPSRILGSSGGLPSSIKSLGSPSYRLPPIKVPQGLKKKITKHCFLCGKKTGLATSYECRCGNNFCSSHRYAETHRCTFDYKTAGRRFLQKSNPIVNAPKLPKM